MAGRLSLESEPGTSADPSELTVGIFPQTCFVFAFAFATGIKQWQTKEEVHIPSLH